MGVDANDRDVALGMPFSHDRGLSSYIARLSWATGTQEVTAYSVNTVTQTLPRILLDAPRRQDSPPTIFQRHQVRIEEVRTDTTLIMADRTPRRRIVRRARCEAATE